MRDRAATCRCREGLEAAPVLIKREEQTHAKQAILVKGRNNVARINERKPETRTDRRTDNGHSLSTSIMLVAPCGQSRVTL